MTKISVIIPVYNTGKYLPECLDSVLNQTLDDIEIICVDDASGDNSFEIITDYAQKDSRIKYKKFEKNKGVSAARNYGIDVAEGEYLYFFDSDDRIQNSYLEQMLKAIEETNSDIVINRNMYTVVNGKRYLWDFQQGMADKIPDNTYLDIKKDTHNVFSGASSKLFRHSLIKQHNLRFPEGYNYEDLFFHYAAVPFANKIYFFKGAEYFYRKTEGSVSSNMAHEGEKVIKTQGLVYDFYERHNLLDKGIKIYNTMPIFNIKDEQTYIAYKSYFKKAGEYILNSDIYNDMDKFFCANILSSKDYKDYIEKYPANAVISYIRRKKCPTTI